MSARPVRSASGWAAQIWQLPRPLLLGLDVDGTLAPIVREPGAARVPRAVLADLRVLTETRGLKLALITGRDARTLAGLVPLEGAHRAVLHGRQYLAPGQPPVAPSLSRARRARLERFVTWARAKLVPRGAWLEDKPGAWGVHVRKLEEKDPTLARDLLRLASQQAERLGLHPRPGRAVVEVEAEPGDKGDALARLIRKLRAKGVVFLGDDRTDMPAIRLAHDQGGVGLFVRSSERPRAFPGSTGSLKDVAQVHALLAALKALATADRHS